MVNFVRSCYPSLPGFDPKGSQFEGMRSTQSLGWSCHRLGCPLAQSKTEVGLQVQRKLGRDSGGLVGCPWMPDTAGEACVRVCVVFVVVVRWFDVAMPSKKIFGIPWYDLKHLHTKISNRISIKLKYMNGKNPKLIKHVIIYCIMCIFAMLFK